MNGQVDDALEAAHGLELAVLEHGEVGLLKAKRELSSQDVRREEQKLEALGALSESHKLEPTLVRELFRRIMEEVVRNHERIKTKS